MLAQTKTSDNSGCSIKYTRRQISYILPRSRRRKAAPHRSALAGTSGARPELSRAMPERAPLHPPEPDGRQGPANRLTEYSNIYKHYKYILILE